MTRPGSNRNAPHRRAIRLMLVDDSITARTVLRRILERQDDMEVVGLASSAEDALLALRTLTVDVILLDLDMPGVGGLEALPRIIEASQGAQIMVVSSLTVEGAEHTLAALSQGAADTLPKPRPGGFDESYQDILVSKIRDLARGTSQRDAAETIPAVVLPLARPGARKRPRVLAIGASTGGIHALNQFFESLPPRIGMPILVTQHLPGSFMEAFARQLKLASGRNATLAEEGSILQADQILIAPGDAHITVIEKRGQLEIKLDRKPAASGCMPSVDPMFASLAEVLGGHVQGVVLSGMGRDGADGASKIVQAGGSILAQDEASSAVWGMPRAVALAGLASAILPPDLLAGRIAACASTS